MGWHWEPKNVYGAPTALLTKSITNSRMPEVRTQLRAVHTKERILLTSVQFEVLGERFRSLATAIGIDPAEIGRFFNSEQEPASTCDKARYF